MERHSRSRTATVACDRCGERYAVTIWSAGVIEPLERDELCSCGELGLRIVSPDTETSTDD